MTLYILSEYMFVFCNHVIVVVGWLVGGRRRERQQQKNAKIGPQSRCGLDDENDSLLF